MEGLTNTERAKSSYGQTNSPGQLPYRAGEQHAPCGRELAQTVDGGVAAGGLEAVALVTHQQSCLAGVDLVRVAAVHLR